MNPPNITQRSVVISGDVTIDWNLIFYQDARDTTALWNAGNTARICPQPGGVIMLSGLIEELGAGLHSTVPPQIYPLQLTKELIFPGDRRFNHSYAIWGLFGEKKPQIWRVSQFLGIDRADQEDDSLRLVDDPEKADIVVLDDANLGFRKHQDRWPKALMNTESQPWIILKLSYPIKNDKNGELLEYLASHRADRLIVVVTANDLRLANAQISRGLSWERIAQDTLWEISYNPNLQELSKCAHVVVSFQTDGAALISSNNNDDRVCQLFFDQDTIENGWSAGVKGGMVGYNTCLTAAIARYLLVQGDEDFSHQTAIAQGIRAGLSAMRVLLSNGYEDGSDKSKVTQITFPYRLVAREIENPRSKFAESDIRDPLSTERFTILSQQCCDDLLGLAKAIVNKGPENALSNIPLGRFGKLLTVDRTEIESYRTVAALIQEYISQEKSDKPISIAVFGAPGSGKSFGIKEIANSLSDRIKEITFNLSQMNSPADLIGALHQVRDEALKGKIPLVFWDEFDTSLAGMPLGWLRYFLAPMQDGSFLEGQVTHPTGRAIFVFAGGTSECMEEFGRRLDEEPKKNDQLFKAAKGPDFQSRLKGFINILGPNPQKGANDPYFVIRRAILLNAILHRLTPQFFTPALQMDDNLLEAFLETRTFRHGVRSMESIVSMSQLSGKTIFERSCLPPVSQLNMHVIGWEFMALVQKLTIEGPILDKLARAVHEDFCAYMSAKGYVLGESTDENATPKTHSSLKPYDQLPAGEKAQNEHNAKDIPYKLAKAGYVMIHARTNELPKIFPDRDLDILAEMEHTRWVKAKLAQEGDWHYGMATDKPHHVHSGLLPWRKMSETELADLYTSTELSALGREELPEDEKAKDRELIRRIPYILGRVGYTVVKLDGGE